MKYKVVVCGGTFDYFHKGHETFLDYAFDLGEKVIIGLTSDVYIDSSKFKIQNYETRQKVVAEFVKKKGAINKVKLVKIDDVFGPTLDRSLKIDAIVVSEDTKKGAKIINNKRKEVGLKELKTLIVPFVKTEDGDIISSSRIRNGEINRMGKVYLNQLWLKNTLVLPGNLRNEFKKPFGTLIPDLEDLKTLIGTVATVGDVTTKKFNELSLNQKISVVDFKVERKKRFEDVKELGFSGNEKIINIDNPAGHLTSEVFSALASLIRQDIDGRIILQINGEEDLVVLPLVLAMPLGSLIFYGQPHEGIVKVEVSEDSKEKAYSLIGKLNSHFT